MVNRAGVKVGNRQQILDYIHTNRERFQSEYHVRKIALIGSFARDEYYRDEILREAIYV